MPREKNQLETVQITISTTEVVKEYLMDLVDTGLYGKNHTEAAERLLSRSVESLVEKGSLKKKKAKRT